MSPFSTSHPLGTSIEAIGTLTSDSLDITTSKLGLTGGLKLEKIASILKGDWAISEIQFKYYENLKFYYQLNGSMELVF